MSATAGGGEIARPCDIIPPPGYEKTRLDLEGEASEKDEPKETEPQS
jgi:hypothetical protein